MALLNILKHPDEFLYKTSKPVTEFNERLWSFLDDMADTLEHANGMGLASPQVGRLLRVFILMNEEGDIIEFINPEIIESSKPKIGEEACLSAPGMPRDMERANRVRVKYQDRIGTWFEREFFDMDAICIQHELDHLDGKLIVDD